MRRHGSSSRRTEQVRGRHPRADRRLRAGADPRSSHMPRVWRSWWGWKRGVPASAARRSQICSASRTLRRFSSGLFARRSRCSEMKGAGEGLSRGERYSDKASRMRSVSSTLRSLLPFPRTTVWSPMASWRLSASASEIRQPVERRKGISAGPSAAVACRPLRACQRA